MSNAGEITLPKADDARVVTTLFFPSSGTKIPTTLTVTTGIEEATDGILMMASVGDVVTADSGGGVPAASFCMRGPGGDIPYLSSDVRDITLRTIYAEFGAAAQSVTKSNFIYDLSHNLDAITKAVQSLSVSAGQQDDLKDLLVDAIKEATQGSATATGFIQSSYRRLAMLSGTQVALDIVPRLSEAVQSRLPEYFEKHPSHFDHDVLGLSVRKYFNTLSVAQVCKTMLLNLYNHDLQQTEVMGAFVGDLSIDPGEDSHFRIVGDGQPATNRIPLYHDIPIADAIMAMTSIDGIIGRYQLPGRIFAHKDMADFPATVLTNVMDEIGLRMGRHLQLEFEKTRARRNFWERKRPQHITPAIVQRLVIIGNGYEDHNRPDRYHREGVGSKLWQYPGGAGRAALSPVYAGIQARYDRLSKTYTGLPALVDINAPIAPAADDPHAGRYPSSAVVEGSVPMLSKYTWFGAHRVFKRNAAAIANEMVFALQGMRQRGEITGERYDMTVGKIASRLRDPDKLEAFCEHLTMDERQIEAAIARDVPAKDTKHWRAIPSRADARLRATPI